MPRAIPAGEMKHGPNALIDEKLPVVVVNTHEDGNAGERAALRKDALKYSRGKGTRRHRHLGSDRRRHDEFKGRNHVIEIPETSDLLRPDLVGSAVAATVVPHRRSPRLRCRPAAKSGEIGHGRVNFVLLTVSLQMRPVKSLSYTI